MTLQIRRLGSYKLVTDWAQRAQSVTLGPLGRKKGDAMIRRLPVPFSLESYMSRKMLAVAAFALMAPIAMAQAQFKFGVAAGATLPSGDLSDLNETGYHLMATAGVHPPLSPVGFRVDGMFNQLNF